MKKNKIHMAIIALSMGLSSSVMAAADVTASDASVATVDFMGSVTSNSCQLATESVQQTVNLGEIKVSTLNNGAAGPRHAFQINLVDCDSSTQGFSVTFEDAQGYDANRDYITNISQGDGSDAKNVGVRIAKIDGGNDLVLGQEIDFDASVDPNSGDAWPQQTLGFDAYLVKTDGGTATAGTVNASATVSITTF